MITKEQIAKWVRACDMYAERPESTMTEEDYIRFEHMMILALAASEQGVEIAQVMSDELPPFVPMCMMSFRPLRSVIATGREEKVRLQASKC
jgi:hypothetical protein